VNTSVWTQAQEAPGLGVFGTSRAEDEPWLSACFIPPPEFERVTAQRSVIIFGDPGSGKTALYRELQSLSRRADGKPVREAGHVSNFAGWWWGIPVTSPDPKLSYELARFITSAEWHKKESSIFGMMPVRKDIYADLAAAFPEKWMQEVFEISLKQFEAGTEPPLLVPTLAAISQLYRNAWYDICTGRNYAADPTKGPDRDYIAKVISEEYAPQVKKLAGK